MKRWAYLLAGVTVFFVAVPVWAHTEFESSTPADRASVEHPVSEIVVVFTLPVTIVGKGFEVLDPGGNIISPMVETDDDMTFILVPAEPLAGGEVGVRYEVEAEDGHVLAGGFSFTVTSPASSATTTTDLDTSTSITGITSSSGGPTASSVSTSTSATVESEESSGSMWLWLGLGVLVVGGAGLYAGMRSRS